MSKFEKCFDWEGYEHGAIYLKDLSIEELGQWIDELDSEIYSLCYDKTRLSKLELKRKNLIRNLIRKVYYSKI